jgi:CheY-like chemotaxis protein
MAAEQGDSALRRRGDMDRTIARISAEEVMSQEHAVSVRIAVAEDEPDIRKTFVRLLELMGHEVVFAVSNGAELLEQSLDDRVDVVFVDLDMPVMDGLAAAEEVERKGIPVILVSGHPDSESVVLDHEPVVARISKPASIESVQRAIRQAVAGRSLRSR